MDFLKRVLIGLTFFTSCLAVALLSISLGTDYWIVCKNADLRRNISSAELGNSSKILASLNISFGLFKGYEERNFGFGVRPMNLAIACLPEESVCMWSTKSTSDSRKQDITFNFYNLTSRERKSYETSGFFSFKLWVSTIAFLVLAITFALLAIFFAGYNVVTTPVGNLAGLVGLYIWNVTATVLNLICILLWVGLYYTTFKDNALNPEDLRLGWTSKEATTFGYSFWIMLGAILLFFLNCILLSAASLQHHFEKRNEVIVNSKPDGVIMLY